MDRKNKIKIAILACVLSILIVMCDTQPDNNLKKKIAGTYIATDGARIILNQDHTFVGKQIDLSRIYHGDEFKGKKIQFSGTWTVEKNYQGYRIFFLGNETYVQKGINHTYLDEGIAVSGKISFTLELGNNEIFSWQGDPDDDKRYSFVGQP